MARVVFTLQDLDQSAGTRHLRQGSLTVSQNTRSTKTGPRRKRRGFARAVVSTYSNADSDNPQSATMTELSPGGTMFRDASENIWERSTDGTTARFQGTHRRPGISTRSAGFGGEHKLIKPMSLAVGTRVWHIALGTLETGSSPTSEPVYACWWITVEDADGHVVREPFRAFDATGNSVTNYGAVYHPGQSKVYIFAVYRNTVVTVIPISTTTFTASSQATFATVAGAKWNTVDAIYSTHVSKVIAAYTSWNESDATVCRARHAFLDTGTNAENTATNAEASNPGTTGAYLCSGVSFLEGQPFTDNKIRYIYWRKSAVNQDSVATFHVISNGTTLAVTDNRAIRQITSTRYTLEHAGVCCGYYSQAIDSSILFSQLLYPAVADEETSNPTGVGNSFNALTTRDLFDNTSFSIATETGTCIGSWLASKPFVGADSKIYVLTGVDSGTDGYQRAFHVRRAGLGFSRVNPLAAPIVAQFFWPDASFQGHRWRGQISASPQVITNSWGWAPTTAAITNGVKVALGRAGETPQTHSIHVVTVDFGAAFSRGIEIYDDLVLYPGGVPMVAGPRTQAHDLSPLLFPIQPPRLTAAGSSGALGAVLVTASFRFRDETGRITRSHTYPDPASLVFNSAGTRTLAVRNLCHIGHGYIEIELWASAPAGTTLHLQTVVPNDPTAFETSIVVDPANFRTDTEQLPISATGALALNPPPSCRTAIKHAERIILSGTPTEGELIYSQPIEPGAGPEFNIEALAQVWIGKGPINALCPVDLNSFAAFRPAQIGVFQGLGPPAGGGKFADVLVLNHDGGVEPSATRGGFVFQTPMGACFQDSRSGRLAAVMPGLRVEDLPPGVEDAAIASKLVAGGRQISDGTVWFQLSSGVVLVIDLRHPDEGNASRWGNWHTWTSNALTASASVGLVENASGPLFLQANGCWRSYRTTGNTFMDVNTAGDDDEYVLMVLTTGKMAPAGPHAEVLVDDIQVLGTHVSASSVQLSTTNDDGTPEAHSVVLSTPFNYSWRPGNLLRTQEFTLTISEQTGSTGEGFELDSVAVEFQANGRSKRLATTRIV